MRHESFGKALTITESDITFESIYGKAYVPTEYIDEIKNANMLIIPNENYREMGDVLFPETTREFFEFIQDASMDGITADIAISDEDFQ